MMRKLLFADDILRGLGSALRFDALGHSQRRIQLDTQFGQTFRIQHALRAHDAASF